MVFNRFFLVLMIRGIFSYKNKGASSYGDFLVRDRGFNGMIFVRIFTNYKVVGNHQPVPLKFAGWQRKDA